MNKLLPIFLLIVGNLALYWVFFGRKRFEQKVQAQLNAAKEKEIENHQKPKIFGLDNRNN